MAWASWHLDPRNAQLKRHCQLCQEDTDGIVCMREIESHGGECPVIDQSPILAGANKRVAMIWEQAQRSANQIQAKDKAYIYCRPESVESLLRVHSVPEDDWAKYMRQVVQMDDVANGLRPIKKGA